MTRFIKEHKLNLFLITAFTFLMWFKIFGQSILGEGYYYFDPVQDFIINGLPAHVMQYDNFARIIFDILSPIFKANISLYMGFEMLVLILINISFYYAVIRITKNKLIAFTTVFLFLSNFMASFEMIAIGNYQRFVQRMPNLIPLLVALPFLNYFLTRENKKAFQIFLILYTLSIFLGHFALFILPLFLIYPVVFSVISRERTKKLIRRIGLSLLLITIALILISQDYHSPISLFEFLNEETFLIQKMFIQLTNTALPPLVIQMIAPLSASPEYVKDMTNAGVFLTLLLGIYGFILVSKNKMQATIYWTAFLSLPFMYFYNLWLYRDGINPLTQVGNARFYYIPSFSVSILWGILIVNLISNFKHTKKLIILAVFLVIYFLNNYFYVSKNIAEIQYKSSSMNTYLSFIKNNLYEITDETTIVTPTSLSWPSPLINFLTHKNIKYIQFEPGWETEIGDRPKDKVIVVGYDYKEDKVLNLTNNFIRGETINYSNFR